MKAFAAFFFLAASALSAARAADVAQPVYAATPSSIASRSYVEGFLAPSTSTQTIYNVTPGKTLYVTDMTISATNTATAMEGYLVIMDSSIPKIPIDLPAAGVGGAVDVPTNIVPLNFSTPKRFATSVAVGVQAGTLHYAVSFNGYEQ